MFKNNKNNKKDNMIYRGYDGVLNEIENKLEILKDGKLIKIIIDVLPGYNPEKLFISEVSNLIKVNKE
jgi:hypothetical protein